MVQNKDQEPPRRGRPRAYKPEEALSRAMNTFWKAGFSGTSLDDLSDATGMNRPSLYGAFGDKRALYLTTLDRYITLSKAAMAKALDPERTLAEALTAVYEMALSFYLPAEGAPRGCFLIGTAATEAVRDEEIRAKLRDALRGFDRAMETRIRLAKDKGELEASADPAALALIASAIMHTLAVRSRAGDFLATLKAIIDTGVQLICSAPSNPAPRQRKARKTAK